jgi:DNA ligase-1
MESRRAVSILLTIEDNVSPSISVPYAALTKTFSLIEATTKRLEKTAILTSFLLLVIQRSKKNDPKSLLQAVYLCINRVHIPAAT